MPKKSQYRELLEQSIQAKELELEAEAKLLKVHFLESYESLKPINLLKTTFKQVVSNPNLKENIADGIMGMATGFVAKKIIIGSTHNPLSNILGKIIEVVVAKKVVNNAGEIKAIGNVLLKKLLQPKTVAKP